MLTIPNVSFEADLSASPYNRQTLGLTAKYNWPTYHRYTPYCAFNLFDIRPEFRYYFRTHSKRNVEKKSFNDFEEWFDYSVASRKKPKDWRTYYIGGYADYASYSFKFSPEGLQGYALGFGVSMGYGIPLYQYEKIAVDLELGVSLGFALSDYDRFAHNPDGYFYYPTGHRDFHPVPFPLVSGLNIAFAIRPVSLKDKYKGENPEKIKFRTMMDDIVVNFTNSNKEAFDFILDPKQVAQYAVNDSLYTADYTSYLDDTYNRAVSDIDESSLSESYKKKALSKVKDLRRKTLQSFMGALEKKENKKKDE